MYLTFLINDHYQLLYISYIISWIFVGNYILLNLFLAILLEGNIFIYQVLVHVVIKCKMIYLMK